MLFSDNEKEIEFNHFNKLLKNSNIKICFVNNASKDKTFSVLKEIKSSNVSIIDIKKNKGLKAAVKAGVRFLTSNQEFRSIFYFEFHKYKAFLNLEKKFGFIKKKTNPFKDLPKIEKRILLNKVYSIEQLINKF